MAYVITDACRGTKDMSCVAVCPVDCIHPTEDESDFGAAEQLYINADECIDCDACATACPVGAIFPEGELPLQMLGAKAQSTDFYGSRETP
ncbi:ferredoxin family protein [Streptomyces sp. NPDC090075]|uniref:4Fe-4S dicluster domain-containing protein n=1 Tax=Streptomyces sp. NPDC090075 TaxID=3365937 RepID=UPI0038089194